MASDYGETWGLVVNEAMVCGLPVIVSDRVGCYPDLVNEGQTGFVFSFGDVDALAKKMKYMIDHHHQVLAMGENANRLIQNYSVENATVGTMKAIQHVLRYKNESK